MMDGLAARLNLSWGYNLSLESGISIAASKQMIAKMKYDGFRIFFFLLLLLLPKKLILIKCRFLLEFAKKWRNFVLCLTFVSKAMFSNFSSGSG